MKSYSDWALGEDGAMIRFDQVFWEVGICLGLQFCIGEQNCSCVLVYSIWKVHELYSGRQMVFVYLFLFTLC